MSKSKFLKPPLSSVEKEKKAEEFLNFSTSQDTKQTELIYQPAQNIRVLKKNQ